jgi:hypothetical protein
MMAGGLRFAIVITHDSADDVAVASLQSRDISVQCQIFTMLVVSPMADAMTDIVEKRARLELNTRLRREVMDGLKLIKKHEA